MSRQQQVQINEQALKQEVLKRQQFLNHLNRALGRIERYAQLIEKASKDRSLLNDDKFKHALQLANVAASQSINTLDFSIGQINKRKDDKTYQLGSNQVMDLLNKIKKLNDQNVTKMAMPILVSIVKQFQGEKVETIPPPKFNKNKFDLKFGQDVVSQYILVTQEINETEEEILENYQKYHKKHIDTLKKRKTGENYKALKTFNTNQWKCGIDDILYNVNKDLIDYDYNKEEPPFLGNTNTNNTEYDMDSMRETYEEFQMDTSMLPPEHLNKMKQQQENKKKNGNKKHNLLCKVYCRCDNNNNNNNNRNQKNNKYNLDQYASMFPQQHLDKMEKETKHKRNSRKNNNTNKRNGNGKHIYIDNQDVCMYPQEHIEKIKQEKQQLQQRQQQQKRKQSKRKPEQMDVDP